MRHSQWKELPRDDASSTGLSALFQLCWGFSTLGPYGPLHNKAQPAGEDEKQRSVPFSAHCETVETLCSPFERQLVFVPLI